MTTAARLARLGLRLGPLGAPTLVASFAPPRPRVGALVLIPHGRTPSNQRLIFQNHSEGPDATLLPESLVEAGKGAEVFLDAFGDRLERCSFRRSPLHRCAQTWEAYTAVLADRGLKIPEIAVDEALVEIDHASWHGKTVDDLSGADRAAAAAHRAGDVLAGPADGESQLDVLERASAWVEGLDEPDRVVVAFGHGTMQNAIEVVLRTYGSRPPAEVFTRVPGKSHLKRGFPHVVFDAAGGALGPLG
jgi:broad specificity phosphatase PhoE